MKQPSQIREEELGLVEDGDAMFESVVWFRGERGAGRMARYQKMYVAVLGKQVLDADPDLEVLGRRIDALGDTINQRRVVYEYVRGEDELPQ